MGNMCLSEEEIKRIIKEHDDEIKEINRVMDVIRPMGYMRAYRALRQRAIYLEDNRYRYKLQLEAMRRKNER